MTVFVEDTFHENADPGAGTFAEGPVNRHTLPDFGDQFCGDDLGDGSGVRILLENDELLKQVQEPPPLEHPAHQPSSSGVVFGASLGPSIARQTLNPLLIRRQRSQAGLQAVAHHRAAL